MTMDAVKWNKRASLVYAVGVWTMFGCYGYYRYTHKYDPPVQMPMDEDNRPNMKKLETTHSKTTIVYKENFVPYSTRLLNLFRSTSESSPDSQNHEGQK